MGEPHGPNAGALLVMAGLVLVLLGVLMWSGALSWIGRLPGDLRFGGERTRVSVPITSMVLLSILLTLVLSLLRRFF